MPFRPTRSLRKVHYWLSLGVLVPLPVVAVTGVLLQLRKQVTWVQPATQKGSGKEPAVSFDAILSAARGVPEAGVSSWADIDRVDVRPRDGIAKVLCKSRWEVQVDLRTGAVLQAAVRRQELIEAVHDGSYFADEVKLYLFLPAAVGLLALWATGVYLFALPWLRRRRGRATGPG